MADDSGRTGSTSTPKHLLPERSFAPHREKEEGQATRSAPLQPPTLAAFRPWGIQWELVVQDLPQGVNVACAKGCSMRMIRCRISGAQHRLAEKWIGRSAICVGHQWPDRQAAIDGTQATRSVKFFSSPITGRSQCQCQWPRTARRTRPGPAFTRTRL